MWRIVEFEKWCPTCIHCSEREEEEPCCTCLDNPVNDDSRKPMFWKADDRSDTNKKGDNNVR